MSRPGQDVRGWLRDELARLLATDPGAIGDDDRFVTLGLDSLRATALADALAQTIGRRVSPALLWAYPSITELADHLDSGVEDTTADDPSARRPARRTPASSDEPIAIVGMACRFPGANDLGEFWDLLRAGTDAVTPVPGNRWTPDPASDGEGVPVEAGFIDQPVDAFDSLFFGISPREAAEIDPQQRLFLEVAWEALEEAGLAGGALAGSCTGVFAGVIWHDFADLQGADVDRLSLHSATGRAQNMVANRLSYVLGLRGPSMTIDSACSSSLLAVHLAGQSLHSGECDVAVAGGVNLMLSPTTMVSLARFGGLSPDGRCKAFDVAGDGFGRGEGCGVVVLKRLSQALADGDRIWCVVPGSAVNNDGPSNGLTAPNPLAQEDVLREAYQRAGVSPAAVHFVETHGTGTALGDPIEASALGAVLGAGRPADAPLVIGSVKTNLGHLEGAAGIAGLIKTALCLRHGGLPPNLHFHHPNPHIDFDGLGLRVPTAFERWPRDRRLAGVSSFGWGGTNVHVVVRGWAEPESLPADSGPIPARRPRAAFVCSPHGHQWVGMGRLMLRTEPAFRRAVEECDRALACHTGWSVLDELFAADDRVRYDDVSVTQPILFTVQVALAAWLNARGVRPDAVVGHSLGEIAAAVIAGFLDVAEGARLVYHYSRHQQRIAGPDHGMAVVELPAAELAELIEPVDGAAPRLVVATHNGPRSTALAGDVDELERMLAVLKARGVLCAMIRVSVAAHSPAIDAITADLVADVGELAVSPGRIPMISTVTGAALRTADVTADYFARNLRQRVRLAEATAHLLATGHDVLVELSASPVLLSALLQSAQDAGGTAAVLGTMGKGDDDRVGVWEALLELGRLGVVRPDPGPQQPELFVLSAKTAEALRVAAVQVAGAIDGAPELPMADLVASADRRADHPHRLAAVASSGAELACTLREYGEGARAGRARVPAGHPKVVFVFPGQGSQWRGMGGDLLAREPVFQAALRRCDEAAARFVDWSIVDELRADDATSRLDRIDVVQPVLVAMEIALAALWQSWGVRPAAVVGHSMGEVAAACVAGAISLEDAFRVVCRRSRLMRRVSGQGAMLAVELTVDEAATAIGVSQHLVSIAVSNSRRSTVLSGDRDALTTIAADLTRREVFCRWVKVDVASHSPQMDALRDDLLQLLDGVVGRLPRIPMFSTVTGRLCAGPELDAHYWIRNLRMPVLFGEQIENLARSGHQVFMEMSPHPILLPAVQQVSMDAGVADVQVLPSLRRGEPAREVMLDGLGALHVFGVPVDRQRAATPGRRVSVLPGYPWQRERHRLEAGTPVGVARARGGSLVGDRLDSAVEPGTHYWRPELDLHTAELGDHVIGGQAVVPGSLYLDLMLRAVHDVDSGAGQTGYEVTGLRFRRPVVVTESGRRVQVVLVRNGAGDPTLVRVFDDDAAGVDPGRRVAVAEATIALGRPPAPGPWLDVAATEHHLTERGMSGDDYYVQLARIGLAYGPAFRLVRRIGVVEEEVFAQIGRPSRADNDHLVHPARLDAALHAAIAPALYPGSAPAGGLVSAGIQRTVVHGLLAADGYVHAVLRPAPQGFRADVSIYGCTGEPLVEMTGVAVVRSKLAVAAVDAPAAGPDAGGAPELAGQTPDRVRDTLLTLATGAERRAAIEALTTECLATVARIPAPRIDPDAQLRTLGLDSLMAMELRNRLEGRIGITLSATAIWNHPTVRQLAPLVAHQVGVSLDDAEI